jgi:hypothetical protein
MTATSHEKLEIDPVILAWFRAQARGWQYELRRHQAEARKRKGEIQVQPYVPKTKTEPQPKLF